jgi:hypothetical protein
VESGGGATDGGASGRRRGRQRRRTATAAGGDGGGGSGCEGEESSETRARVKGCDRSREEYDMWTPQFFLSPVDPTLRF